MKKTVLFVVLLAFAANLKAQVTTPGTGVYWTLDSLVAHHALTFSLSGTDIYLQEFNDLEVLANDTLFIEPGISWLIDSGLRVTVSGALITNGQAPIFIQAIDTAKHFDGFRFEQNSYAHLYNAHFNFGGGLKVLTEDFYMDSSAVGYSIEGASTGGAISFSRGRPVVKNSSFWYNEGPAFSSAANLAAAPRLINNILVRNNQANTNRPQINLGPSGTNDTTIVRGNIIIGDPLATNAGGISVSSLLGTAHFAIIDSNEVLNCRYGITMAGSGVGRINANILENNNVANQPMTGGSGISLNSTSTLEVSASYNEIRGNLWGITLIGKATLNLGDTNQATYNPGKNIFSGNGNGGAVYALYNNTDLPVPAMNNCWEEDTATGLTAEDVIFHLNDDNTLGQVFFNPVWKCNEVHVGVTEEKTTAIEIYPNPTGGRLTLELEEPSLLQIFDLTGSLVFAQKLGAGKQSFLLSVPSGVYIARISVGETAHTQKVVVR